ncbi:MAG: hypothetical protein AAF664_03700 [Planctomycetota bacterium]
MDTLEHAPPELLAKTRHRLRNEVNQITLGLHLFSDLIDAGQIEEADKVFDSVQQGIRELEGFKSLELIEAGRPD